MKPAYFILNPLILLTGILGAGLLLAGCTVSKGTPSPATDLANPVLNLAGSEWRPLHPTNAKENLSKDVRAEGEVEYFIQFRTDNKVTGFSGCNHFFGNYESEGKRLIIGPLGSTRKLCQDRMEAERLFLTTLQSVQKIDFDGKTLTLIDAAGQVLIVLYRSDWD